MATTENVQATDKPTVESQPSHPVVVPAAAPSSDGDPKGVTAKETVLVSGPEVIGIGAATMQTQPAAKVTVDLAPAVVTEVVKHGEASDAETAISANDKDATSKDVSAVPAPQAIKTEEVKVKSVSAVVASVAADLKNVEAGVAKEAVPAPGHDAPAPSLLTTLEGGLRIVEKEAVKGVVETVATVEQHPELIAEGALATVVGAASMIQPELLPEAVAIVGKMASDSVKKTVTKIATDEEKKVATAIAKDVSADAAKEKAAQVAAAATVDAAKPALDGAKEQIPATENAPDTKTASAVATKGTAKAREASNGLTNSTEGTEKPIIEKTAEPEASKEVASREPLKAATQLVFTAKSALNMAPKVEDLSDEVKTESESDPKQIPTLEVAKETPLFTPAHLSISQQAPQASVIASVACFTKTVKPTAKSTAGPVAPVEKQVVTISQESLDLLHQKIDAMHEAIKQITETLALHLPQPNPAIDDTKQNTAEVAPSVHSSESELISALTDAAEVPTQEPAKADSIAAPVEQSPLQRPSLEKRSSVLGSMGKIFWPFGSSSSSKTVDSDAPKVPTVMVSEVPLTPGIEV